MSIATTAPSIFQPWSEEPSTRLGRRKIRARIGGLHCSLCTGTIEKALGRLPGVDKWQREFNTGIAIMVQHGDKPNAELIERAEGIRKQWMDYFAITTGHRASMTANPR